MLICISDYWQQREYYQLTASNNVNVNNNNNNKSKVTSTILKALPVSRTALKKAAGNASIVSRAIISLDGIAAAYWLREIKDYHAYRWHLLHHKHLQACQLLWVQIMPPARDIIDYKWNDMLHRTLWIRIECDYLMSWLSTLGGGFSALGEQFVKCAETAGKISLKQLYIGMRLGDPFLQARCKLYYSISLIQTGKLRAAKHLIREQYEFARKYKETDTRLVKMCHGIWHRLQYEYRLRAQERAKLKLLLMAAGDQ